MPTRDQILEALKVVIDPELHRSIVELGMVRSLDISEQGVVNVTVSLTTPGGQRPQVSAERKILPLEAHGLKVISIGFFLKEDEAVVWRGPMLHKALTQFLEDVAWGELDYLLIDLPPGTGDVSMTLSQLLPQATFMIVTTPQDAAQKVARRAAQMADKVNLEISSVIENMSGFTAPDGTRYPIFGEGGGQRLADELEVPLLAQVPFTMLLRSHADAGIPLVAVDPDDPAS